MYRCTPGHHDIIAVVAGGVDHTSYDQQEVTQNLSTREVSETLLLCLVFY